MGGWKSCLLAAAHLVGADGGRDDEGVVLLFRYLDAVRVADAEPARRHLGHSVAVPFDLVLVVDDVALGLEVVTALHVDRVCRARRPNASVAAVPALKLRRTTRGPSPRSRRALARAM